MAPAVDEDESVNWADFSVFNNQQQFSSTGYGETKPSNRATNDSVDWQDSFIPIQSPKGATALPVSDIVAEAAAQKDTSPPTSGGVRDGSMDEESDIEELSERLEVLKE
ncbi:hypothetical protein GGI07_005413 [Coemansia sp. Benny D115]|nr:hypothetical protein GGI07_005413 [Coemansia sp. Benny D115]